MDCELFWCRQISVPRLVETLPDGGAKQILPVSNLLDVGRCSELTLPRNHREMEWQAQRAMGTSKSLRECCCIVMASCFAVCSNARVSRLPGMSWGEFIADGKRAARFEAGISWEELAAN